MQKVKAQESIPVTKDLTVTLNSFAESLSDVEYWQFSPNGQQIDYRVFQNEGDMTADQTFNLGTQSDDRGGCVEMISGRRMGVCEDGNYRFELQSTDAAGNKSGRSSYLVERDTVRPRKPEGEAFICGNHICIKLSGEAKNKVSVYDKIVASLNDQGINNSFVGVYNFKYDTDYSISINTLDLAENKSETATIFIHTPSSGIGDGSVESGSKDNPYGTETLESYNKNIEIEGIIGPGDSFTLTKFTLPAPKITYTETDSETKNVDFWGIALNKDYVFNTNIKLQRVITYGQAVDECQTRIPVSIVDYGCVTQKLQMGWWEFGQFEIGLVLVCNEKHPWPWQYNERVTCMRSATVIVDAGTTAFDLVLDNVMLIAIKNGAENITKYRDCSIGERCYEQIFNPYLHNRKDGTWQLRFSHEIIKPGEYLKTKIKAFGNININFEGKDYNGTFGSNGWDSPYSNEVAVKEPPKSTNFFDNVVHPLIDNTCATINTSTNEWEHAFTYMRGKTNSHSGVDLAKYTGCHVNTIGDGYILSQSYDHTGGGFMIKISHGNNIESWYLHLKGDEKNLIGNFYLNPKSEVIKGDRIAYMSNTGHTIPEPTIEEPNQGTHLHLTLKVNGVKVNPEEEQYLGTLSGNGRLYKSSRLISNLIYTYEKK